MTNNNKQKQKSTGSTVKATPREGESFAMASFLISGNLRPHVVAFFSFARDLDDLADNPDILPADKLLRINAMEQALKGQISDPDYETSLRMAASLKVSGVSIKHCLDLIEAARCAALKSRYDRWQDLIDFCTLSAAPVGRYLIELHGENEKIVPLSDALCVALQLINNIQDCSEDYINLDRVYIPLEILNKHNAPVGDLEKNKLSPAMRSVLDECLDKIEDLIDKSRPLQAEISSRSLAIEVAVITKVAKKMTKSLRKKDPLAEHVMLNRFQYMSAGFRGVFSFPVA